MDKFLERHKFPKLTQEEMYHYTDSLLITKDIFSKNIFPQRKTPGQMTSLFKYTVHISNTKKK